MSELNKQNIIYNSRNKIVSKFVGKLLKYRIMFKYTLTCLVLDYRDASLITLYFFVLGISFPKIRSIGLLNYIKMFKMKVQTFLLLL